MLSQSICRYVYGGEVSSLRTSDDEIVNEGQCLSISDAIGRRLRDGDKIRYKLKLMRKADSAAGGGANGAPTTQQHSHGQQQQR